MTAWADPSRRDGKWVAETPKRPFFRASEPVRGAGTRRIGTVRPETGPSPAYFGASLSDKSTLTLRGHGRTGCEN